MPTSTTPTFRIRPIEARDDAAIAAIIRSVMPEFGASGCGFAINDPEVDWMHRAYAEPRSAYFVIERNDASGHPVVEGGGGIAPLSGGDSSVCELRKMYFLPSLRGLGAGTALMARCLDAARASGFQRCYLETLTGMDAAMRLYERSGFRRIDTAMGATGHGGCNTFYLRELAAS
ncbi:MAG: GNAT family N-acetyltransferase [Lysobacter sp.]|nr:GNAT family N-acetyltransferase [Lysobacter sp.]